MTGAVLAAAMLLAGCGGGTSRTGPSTFASRPADALVARLVEPPRGADPGSSDWARDYKPSLPRYVAYFYAKKARPKVTSTLKQQGVRDIAHVLWVSQELQSDVVVLQFRDTAGASAQLEFLESNAGKDTAFSRTVLDTAHDPVAFSSDTAVKDGLWLTKAYAQVGTYVVEQFVYSGTKAPLAAVTRTMSMQLDRLG
ncbi:hypothetical protein GCM10027265_31700 [Jatrophihabitans fulvus]